MRCLMLCLLVIGCGGVSTPMTKKLKEPGTPLAVRAVCLDENLDQKWSTRCHIYATNWRFSFRHLRAEGVPGAPKGLGEIVCPEEGICILLVQPGIICRKDLSRPDPGPSAIRRSTHETHQGAMFCHR